eukprot:19610-Heterococcus_DN1.PRE.1
MCVRTGKGKGGKGLMGGGGHGEIGVAISFNRAPSSDRAQLDVIMQRYAKRAIDSRNTVCMLVAAKLPQINTNVMLVNNTQRTIKAAMGPLPPVPTASATDAAPVSPFKGNAINKTPVIHTDSVCDHRYYLYRFALKWTVRPQTARMRASCVTHCDSCVFLSNVRHAV